MNTNVFITEDMFGYNEFEEVEQSSDIDYEHMEIVKSPMTDYIYLNCKEKFKKSYFGDFFKESYLDHKFEDNFYAFGFETRTVFNFSDIKNNNIIYNFVNQFKDVLNFDNVYFSLEIKYRDSDMKNFINFDIYFNIDYFHYNDGISDRYSSLSFTNIESIDDLLYKTNIASYPDWCLTLNDKIFFMCYSQNPVVISEDIDIKNYKNSHLELNRIIEGFILISDIEEI